MLGMKVLDLSCDAEHSFEGWFASEDDFQDQRQRGLVSCPLCASTVVEKKLSAPRLNLGAREPAQPSPERTATALTDPSQLTPEQFQATWMRMARHILANTEDVGTRFADEARRMHQGETEARGIRGQATPEETQALLEEGVPVMPLPLPEALKGPRQ